MYASPRTLFDQILVCLPLLLRKIPLRLEIGPDIQDGRNAALFDHLVTRLQVQFWDGFQAILDGFCEVPLNLCHVIPGELEVHIGLVVSRW